MRQLSRGIAAEHGANGIRWQRCIAEHAAIGLDGSAPHNAFDQCEHAGLTQPVRVFLGHIDQNAYRAIFRQLNLVHAANGET